MLQGNWSPGEGIFPPTILQWNQHILFSSTTISPQARTSLQAQGNNSALVLGVSHPLHTLHTHIQDTVSG